MKNFPAIGIQSPNILIPNKQYEMEKWAVIACDQFTSQPEYWQTVKNTVGTSPSTYHLILPEAYLGTELEKPHTSQINSRMQEYVESDVFRKIEGMVYIERFFNGSVRKGLVAALDLEQYDYSADSSSLIRATEGTIIDRLPPRIKIRSGAFMEIPHILVLIDDPDMTVIQPIAESPDELDLLYDFNLMQNSGHIKGYRIASSALENKIVESLGKLKEPDVQANKYSVALNSPPLLFAVGDGNHSLATAKTIWERNKHSLPDNHPSRYALVEIVNLHDESIEFKPIHRLIRGINNGWLHSIKEYFSDNLIIKKSPDLPSLRNEVANNRTSKQIFGAFVQGSFWLIEIKQPVHTLTVGSVQKWIDDQIEKGQIKEVDYIHGDQTIVDLGSEPGNAGIFLTAIRKGSFFQSVIKDGALPRKTFSMGDAYQKRFYIECRKIK